MILPDAAKIQTKLLLWRQIKEKPERLRSSTISFKVDVLSFFVSDRSIAIIWLVTLSALTVEFFLQVHFILMSLQAQWAKALSVFAIMPFIGSLEQSCGR